ncbi:MAG: metal ABC transporter substrate-binding protein, partial [Candidatus Geothermarchaeales archaeon]
QPIRVVASIEALAGIVREVGGGRVTVETLIPEGVEPHEFQATPEIVASVTGADLLVGLGHFPFEDQVVEATGVLSVGIEQYERTGLRLSPWPGELGYATRGPHLLAGNRHGYWLKPINGLAIARSVVGKLIELDPAGEPTYMNLLSSFEDEVAALEAYFVILSRERGLSGLPVAVAFPAEAYVAEAFGMDVVASLAIGENVFIGGGELIELEDALRGGEIAFILASELSKRMTVGRFAQQLAADTGTPMVFVRTTTLEGLRDYGALLMYNAGVLSVNREVSERGGTEPVVFLIAIIVLAAVVVLETGLLLRVRT